MSKQYVLGDNAYYNLLFSHAVSRMNVQIELLWWEAVQAMKRKEAFEQMIELGYIPYTSQVIQHKYKEPEQKFKCIVCGEIYTEVKPDECVYCTSTMIRELGDDYDPDWHRKLHTIKLSPPEVRNPKSQST